jgi:coenzyme F420-reducing hydrogenase beta subunit
VKLRTDFVFFVKLAKSTYLNNRNNSVLKKLTKEMGEYHVCGFSCFVKIIVVQYEFENFD